MRYSSCKINEKG